MTVATTSGNVPAEFEGNIGLEDLDASDLALPRIRIMHGDAKFKDSLSNEEFDTLDCVILGMVKQRIMWDKTVDDGDKPLCKSPDFGNGFPNVDPDAPTDKRFPWSRSNFDPSQFPAGGGHSINGLVTLPCAQCKFKEWDNSAQGGRGAPPCAEQYTFIVEYSTDGWGSSQTALLTLQKTGLKPAKSYMSSFVQSKTPMFTVFTTIKLNLASRGSVKYSVPQFTKGQKTERMNWTDYANTARQVREFVRTPPRPAESEEEVVTETTNNEWNGPAATQTQPQAPAAPAATTAPVAAPAPAPAPQQAAAPAPAAAPATAPPAAAATPTPAPAPAADDDDDDDLPF